MCTGVGGGGGGNLGDGSDASPYLDFDAPPDPRKVCHVHHHHGDSGRLAMTYLDDHHRDADQDDGSDQQLHDGNDGR